jgi:hypothetical protein
MKNTKLDEKKSRPLAGWIKGVVVRAGLLAAMCALPAYTALASFSDVQQSMSGYVNHFYGNTRITSGTLNNSGSLTYSSSSLPGSSTLFNVDVDPGITTTDSACWPGTRM